jgi:hypothetical protein
MEKGGYENMRHTREEVIQRTVSEFELLEGLVAHLKDEDWERPVPRPETKDPWTVKDSLAHITHWKADVARSARGQPRPLEERGTTETESNRIVYLRWRDRPPQEVLEWHRQVHKDVLKALKEAPDEWFTSKERRKEWPYDLDGHSAYHRVRDIEQALSSHS